MFHRSRPLTRPASNTRRVLVIAAIFGAGFLITVSRALAAAPDTDSSAPLVAAASDLKFALDEILATFRAGTGLDVRVTYGSSGNFARQIEQGAPFDLFLSADESYVERLAQRGLTRDRGAPYAVGRIVLYVPRGSPLAPDPELRGLAQRLADGSAGRIAIANPDHAPYGRAAEQALRRLGLWEAVAPRLVLGENVVQAAQFAGSGNAEGGIIAYSLALAPALRDRGTFVLLPESLHAPLRQRMVLLRRASPAALRLYEYLQAPAARAVLVRYGFALPGT